MTLERKNAPRPPQQVSPIRSLSHSSARLCLTSGSRWVKPAGNCPTPPRTGAEGGSRFNCGRSRLWVTSDFPSPRLSTSVHEGTSALNYSGKIPLVLGRKPNERISGTQITDSTSQFNKLAGIWCEFQPHPACTLV